MIRLGHGVRMGMRVRVGQSRRRAVGCPGLRLGVVASAWLLLVVEQVGGNRLDNKRIRWMEM